MEKPEYPEKNFSEQSSEPHVTLSLGTRFSKVPKVFGRISSAFTLVPEVFLEPRKSREEAKSNRKAARKEKPLVALDLNATFMQTPWSGSDPQARIG